eukprot:3633322-Rhodomonas_salina.2
MAWQGLVDGLLDALGKLLWHMDAFTAQGQSLCLNPKHRSLRSKTAGLLPEGSIAHGLESSGI